MYTIIDLFCGIGGFSYGFEMTGKFSTQLGIDFWDVALETFKINHPNTEILQGDIKAIPDSFFSNYRNLVDVIIAGPPCQGFSMAGKRDVLDERNNLFKEVIRVAKIVEPKIIVIENVVGLLSMINPDGKLIKDEIIKDLENLGYFVESKVLSADNFGVPQKRKRIIFIASKSNNIVFPIPDYGKNKKPYVTVGDAISNIPENGTEYLETKTEYQKIMSGRKDIVNHDSIKHSPIIVKRMASIPQGGNWKDIPESLGNGGGIHSNNYRRLSLDKPSITIKHVSKSMIVHPIYNRTPTVREVARLQSFNDNFVFTGTKYNQHQQLANAVPPLLGKAIAQAVLEILGELNVKND